jgi:hypothetical protein
MSRSSISFIFIPRSLASWLSFSFVRGRYTPGTISAAFVQSELPLTPGSPEFMHKEFSGVRWAFPYLVQAIQECAAIAVGGCTES